MYRRIFTAEDTILMNRLFSYGYKDYVIAKDMKAMEKEIYLYRWITWGNRTPKGIYKFCVENNILPEIIS